MKYVARLPDGDGSNNVNVSKRHPLIELAILLGGAFALVLAAYGALGLAVDQIAQRLPVEYEMKMSGLGGQMFPGAVADDERAAYLDSLLARLRKGQPDDGRDYRIAVLDNAEGAEHPANALALPGGQIVVFCGLLEQAESENELAMVLGHELGHFAHRHHLRSLGRGLVVTVMSLFLLGQDSGVSQFLIGSLSVAGLQHSKNAEAEADVYGIELLNDAWGHVGGATSFFQRNVENDMHPAMNAFFSTHPLSSSRVKALEGLIKDRSYATGPLTAVPEDMQCRLQRSSDHTADDESASADRAS